MSTSYSEPQTYTATPATPKPLLSDQDLTKYKKWIADGRRDRRRFEVNWQESLAFCAGKHWLEYRRFGVGGRFILPPLKRGQLRYTADKITDLRMTVLGEFSMDDDRPSLLFRTDDMPTEDFADTANDAIAAGWETEWLGDRTLMDVKRTMIDLGTAVARCRFDPTAGPARLKSVPHQNGQPILDETKAREYVSSQQAAGQSANLKTIHEGRIRWDSGTPFNVLVPAGVKREDKFGWEAWVEPVRLDIVKEQYGQLADTLKPEAIQDINSIGEGESQNQAGSDTNVEASGMAKLEGHVFVYTLYERPCAKWPDGRVIVFAGADMRCLSVTNQLPYKAPDGTRRSGIHYFHYIRLTDRFWSRGLLDLVKDGQRAYNTARSQVRETINRGQPFIIAQENSIPKRTGVPVEIIPLKPNTPSPIVSSGVPVGTWMYEETTQIDTDIKDASGLQDVLQGDNPQNVGNYSQLALLQEQAGTKFTVIMADFKETVGHLVEDSVSAIRLYWGRDRLLALEGPDGTLKAFSFDATKIPDFYRVYVAKGAAQPRSQAAQLKKVDDLAAYSINSGQPLPLEWVKESYDAGKPVDMPQQDRHDDLDKALFENEGLLQGVIPQVEYYEDHALHVQVHRSVQARADATGQTQISAACEQHIQAHLAQAAANAQAQATGANPGNVTGPGAQPQQPPSAPATDPFAAALAAQQPGAGAPAAPGMATLPNPYSIFPGSPTAGRGNFGI